MNTKKKVVLGIVGSLVLLLCGLLVYAVVPKKDNTPTEAAAKTAAPGGGGGASKTPPPSATTIQSATFEGTKKIAPGTEGRVTVSKHYKSRISPSKANPTVTYFLSGKQVWSGKEPYPKDVFHDEIVFQNTDSFEITVAVFNQ